MRITIVPWNPETDRCEIYHDDVLVWSDSLSHIDQYFRFHMPVGKSVILELST